MKPRETSISLLAVALGLGFGVVPLHGESIMRWNASDWSGTGDWTSSVGSQTLTIAAGTPTKIADNSLSGEAVEYVNFGNGAQDWSFVNSTAAHPLVGLQEFSISVVFRSADNGGGAYLEDNFFRYNAMAGYYGGTAGDGSWSVGISKNPLEIAGGTGLGGGNVGTGGGGVTVDPVTPTILDGNWHTLTFVVEQIDVSTFNQYMYVDGVLTESDLGLSYGGTSSSIVSGAFKVGKNEGDGGSNYAGDIAVLDFDNTALDATTISGLHDSYLGLLIDDETDPQIATVSPINTATGVAPFADLSVTFDEFVVAAPGNNIRIFDSTDPVTPVETIAVDAATVSVDGAVVTIDPNDAIFSLGSSYFVEIDSGAFEDVFGNSFAGISGSGTWSFTIQSTAPAIDTLSPANGATDVALDSNLVITFDADVALGSAGNITIRDDSDDSVIEVIAVTSGNVTVSASDEVTIDPVDSLPAGVDCYVQIDPGVIEDTSGNAFLGITDSTTWTFSTVPPLPSYLIYSESFDYLVASGNGPIDPTGWKSNRGAANTESDDTTTTDSQLGIVIGSLTGGGGYDGDGSPTAEGYLFADGALGTDRQMYWTEQNVGDISEIAYFEVDLRNDNSSEELRLALRIGSDWYVARPGSATETSENSSTWDNNIQIEPSNLEFAALSFTAGGGPVIAGLDPLEPDATTVSLPTTGTVTAFGFYNTTTNANARIDNFEVYSYVEPTVETFSTWIGGFGLSGDDLAFDADPDGDGNDNGVEAFFGTNPAAGSDGITQFSKSGSSVTFQHPEADPALSDVTGTYEWSLDLVTWNASGDTLEGVQVSIPEPAAPVGGITTVTATIDAGDPDSLFLRVVATQN